MTTVHAGQHIYTNVEEEQSPSKRGGYQTLFYTRSVLSEIESEEIEARVPYYRSEGDPVKRVFFTTSTGKRVVAYVIPLANTDRHGRKLYLAHSLVFTPEAFARLGADPFWVFRRFPFLTTGEEALKRGDFHTGDIPEVTLKLPVEPERATEAVKCWSTQALKKLTLLALRANQSVHDHQVVAIVGEPPQVENALEAAFCAVPTLLRPYCTFDTYVYKCNFPLSYYWARGELTPSSNPTFTLVDTQTHQVMESGLEQHKTAYERWVVSMLESQELDALASSRDQAFSLCEWLEGRADNVSLIDPIPPEVVVPIFQMNTHRVQLMLRGKLGKRLPSALLARVFEPIYDQTEPVELFRHLRQGFALPQLLEELYKVYETLGFRAPSREEMRALGVVLQHAEHHVLRLFYACWTDQHTQLRQALASLDEDAYCQFVQTALHYGIGKPLALLIQGRGEVFLELYLASSASREQGIAAVVQAALDAGEVTCLSHLIPYVAGQSAQDLRTVGKILLKRPDIPESFRHAISEAIAALPPANGLRSFLHALLESYRRRGENDDNIAC